MFSSLYVCEIIPFPSPSHRKAHLSNSYFPTRYWSTWNFKTLTRKYVFRTSETRLEYIAELLRASYFPYVKFREGARLSPKYEYIIKPERDGNLTSGERWASVLCVGSTGYVGLLILHSPYLLRPSHFGDLLFHKFQLPGAVELWHLNLGNVVWLVEVEKQRRRRLGST